MTKVEKATKEFIKSTKLRKVTVDVLTDYASKEGYELYEYSQDFNSGYENDVTVLLKSIGKYDYAQNVHAFAYTDKNKKLLFIEQYLTYDQQLSLLSHEVGHIYLKHTVQKGVFLHDIEQENEANEFAYLLCKNRPELKIALVSVTIAIVAALTISIGAFIFRSDEDDNTETQAQPTIEEHIPEQNKTPVKSNNVLVTRTGEKYHMNWCSEVIDNDTHEIEMSEAIRLGYKPCKVCRPDMHFNAE